MSAAWEVRIPTRHLERHLGKRVAGVDEVGRGPLAGPVVASCVILPVRMSRTLASEIDDSKKLDASTRERICRELKSLPGIEVTVSAASVSEIARLNILHATMLAMRRAISRLEQSPDAVIVDGNRRPTMDCRTLCIIGGDASSTSIAAASIVAKVVRDRLMARLDLRFPGYGWDKNAGYATAAHRDALRRLGPTPHHRAAFGTVRQLAARAQLPIGEMECSS